MELVGAQLAPSALAWYPLASFVGRGRRSALALCCGLASCCLANAAAHHGRFPHLLELPHLAVGYHLVFLEAFLDVSGGVMPTLLSQGSQLCFG